MIDQEAIDFIVAQEDGSETYYEKTEAGWDWPEGESGPTCGIGYDCGYVTNSEVKEDWTGIVDDHTVQQIMRGVGFTGTSAHYFVMRNRSAIDISWEQSLREFTEREIPKWEKRMEDALPNWSYLSPLSAGALLSVGYNRGTGGFNSTVPRFLEMRLIKSYMAAGQWALIPASIRHMKRLWPEGGDLYKRRIAEGDLFEKGLPQCRSILASSTSTSGSEASASSQQQSPPEPSTSQT